ADGATMLILYALGGRAVAAAARALGDQAREVAARFQLALLVVIAVGAAVYLARRPRAVPRTGAARSSLLAASVGALGGGAVVLAGGAGESAALRALGSGPIAVAA